MVVYLDDTIALRDLLFKLGIKSAEVHLIERAVHSLNKSFGAPDQLIMDTNAYELYRKLMAENKKK